MAFYILTQTCPNYPIRATNIFAIALEKVPSIARNAIKAYLGHLGHLVFILFYIFLHIRQNI